MGYLKIKMQEPHVSWWEPIFNWIRDNTVLFACFALAWKGIDRAFKFYSNAQAERLREMVKEEIKSHVNPVIERLSTSIDKLQESIWELRNKI